MHSPDYIMPSTVVCLSVTCPSNHRVTYTQSGEPRSQEIETCQGKVKDRKLIRKLFFCTL